MWRATLFAIFSCVHVLVNDFAVASHFRGAVVQWRPINTATFDGRVKT